MAVQNAFPYLFSYIPCGLTAQRVRSKSHQSVFIFQSIRGNVCVSVKQNRYFCINGHSNCINRISHVSGMSLRYETNRLCGRTISATKTGYISPTNPGDLARSYRNTELKFQFVRSLLFPHLVRLQMATVKQSSLILLEVM